MDGKIKQKYKHKTEREYMITKKKKEKKSLFSLLVPQSSKSLLHWNSSFFVFCFYNFGWVCFTSLQSWRQGRAATKRGRFTTSCRGQGIKQVLAGIYWHKLFQREPQRDSLADFVWCYDNRDRMPCRLFGKWGVPLGCWFCIPPEWM